MTSVNVEAVISGSVDRMPTIAARFSENDILAANLREYADILEQQHADGFRVLAYRKAAGVIEELAKPVSEILEEAGQQGLVELPGIGRGIASALTTMISTGHWPQLECVRGTLEPEQIFRTIPGIGRELAKRICGQLHIETLEDLEVATHDGRLEKLRGFAGRRAQMVRTALAERLGRPRLRQMRRLVERPPVPLLLDVDREYRDRANAGELRRIAPKRFNPKGEAWLPIWHATRGSWTFTALYSNTALAHELGRTTDWVVIYYQKDTLPEGQCTVVTETHGHMAGQRVVRGREEECQAIGVSEPPGNAGDADAA